MEELVTVDEVGGEDDSIIEPDLPELEEFASCPKVSAEEGAGEQPAASPKSSLEGQETANKTCNSEESVDVGDKTETAPVSEKATSNLTTTSTENQKLHPVVPELGITTLSDFTCEELKASEEETCAQDKAADSGMSEEPVENHISVLEDSQTQEVRQMIETITNGAQPAGTVQS